MKPRVFVSSAIKGFEEYREVAKKGIIIAGGEPVLVEDYPSLAISPRSVCLDGVKNSDIFIAIVGNREGWTAPSGKLVVEEEYEEACRCNLHILAFIQKVKHDVKTQNFINKLSDYVDGVFRSTFITSDELQDVVEKALMPSIQHYKNPEVDIDMINEKLSNPYKIYNEASLRFLLVPERIDEFIDPGSLESPMLKGQLLEIGHFPRVELFSYERPKKTELEINGIVILQSEESRYQDIVEEVRLELTTGGLIVIDMNVTGCVARGQPYNLMSSMVIIEDDVSSRLNKCFAFTREFFQTRDPFKRYDRMLYNVALSGVGHRTLMPKPPQGSSYSMGSQGDEVIIVFDKPRVITRADLEGPKKEIETTLALVRRRLKS